MNSDLCFIYKAELIYLFTLIIIQIMLLGKYLCWNMAVHQSLYIKLVLKSGILGVMDERESIFPSSLHF